MLKKTHVKRLLWGAFIVISFIYGLTVGTYKIFPFSELNMIKDLVSSKAEPKSFETPYYLHKTSFFKLKSQSDYDVVFIGDSITDGSDWYDVFPDLKVANRGINGDTTAGVLNRMDTILNTNAEKAFLMIGANDIGAIDVEVILHNYVNILKQLKNSDIEPIVLSTLFTYNHVRDNKIIRKLNTKLKILCSDLGITYVDLNVHLSIDGELNKDYSFDGIHLNGIAYSIWAKAIKDYIY